MFLKIDQLGSTHIGSFELFKSLQLQLQEVTSLIPTLPQESSHCAIVSESTVHFENKILAVIHKAIYRIDFETAPAIEVIRSRSSFW